MSRIIRTKKVLLSIAVALSFLAFFVMAGIQAQDVLNNKRVELGSQENLIFGGMFLWLILSLFLSRSLNITPIGYSGEITNGSAEKLNPDVLINSIADGVMLVGSDGVTKVFNPIAATITGWTPQEAIGLDYKSLIKFFDDKGAELSNDHNPITECFKTGAAVQKDSLILKTKDQKTVELDIMASPIKDKDKSPFAVMVIFRDVSKQRGEERQRAEFISTASHEMRTPVAAIEGYLALAMNDKVSQIDPAARGYLEKAHASTQHLGKLFQDLLTAAKSEDGRLTSHPIPIEVGVFLREVAERARFAAEKKGLELKYKMSANSETVIDTTAAAESSKIIEPIYYVMADPDRMQEVITNLIDNAIKYTEEGGITVAMSATQGNIVISIADTGPGISKEDLPHLFQKFYRVDNSDTRQIGGTGLGLFICKKIVELYNGKIWADSIQGKGSVFNIALPQLDSVRAKDLLQQEAANKMPLDDSAAAATANIDSPGQNTT